MTPDHRLSAEAQAALEEVLAREDPAILVIVLSRSAARGIASERSDVDVYVVLADDAAEGLEASRSPAIDEIPKTMADLEDVPRWGTIDHYFRWSFAYAEVLRDETGGRIAEAVRRQAMLTPAPPVRARVVGRPAAAAGRGGAGRRRGRREGGVHSR